MNYIIRLRECVICYDYLKICLGKTLEMAECGPVKKF